MNLHLIYFLYLFYGCFQVPGEASETDSEGDPEQAPGSHDNAQILKRDLPPLIVVRDHPDMHSIVEDRPSPSHRPHGKDE